MGHGGASGSAARSAGSTSPPTQRRRLPGSTCAPVTPSHRTPALLAAVAGARSAGEVGAELRSLFSLADLHYWLGRVPEALEAYRQTSERALKAGLAWVPMVWTRGS